MPTINELSAYQVALARANKLKLALAAEGLQLEMDLSQAHIRKDPRGLQKRADAIREALKEDEKLEALGIEKNLTELSKALKICPRCKYPVRNFLNGPREKVYNCLGCGEQIQASKVLHALLVESPKEERVTPRDLLFFVTTETAGLPPEGVAIHTEHKDRFPLRVGLHPKAGWFIISYDPEKPDVDPALIWKENPVPIFGRP